MLNYVILKKRDVLFARLSHCSDGIIRLSINKPVEITIEHLNQLFSAYNEFVEGQKYPVIYLIESDGVVIDDVARNYLRTNEKSCPKICVAVMTKNLPLKIIANFYLKFHKPNTKIKVFNNEQEATTWCLKINELVNSSLFAS